MTNKLVGKTVVFTGAKNSEQDRTFEVGKEYTVERFGTCGLGQGVLVEGILIIAFGNFEAKKPEPLETVQDLLRAVYNDETIVSVDRFNSVDDTYEDGDFSNVANFEIEGNQFYVESEWLEYKALQEEIERLEVEGYVDEAPTPEPARDLTFFDAMELVKQGKAVEVYVDGSKSDTYRRASDLTALTSSEIERGEWQLI